MAWFVFIHRSIYAHTCTSVSHHHYPVVTLPRLYYMLIIVSLSVATHLSLYCSLLMLQIPSPQPGALMVIRVWSVCHWVIMWMSTLKAEQFLSRFLERIDGDAGCPSTVINGHSTDSCQFSHCVGPFDIELQFTTYIFPFIRCAFK